jgi:hypothetical protein
MSGTPGAESTSRVAASKEKPVTTRKAVAPDLDALIAAAVAKAMADTLPGIVAAVVAKIVPPVAPVAPVVAPVAPAAVVASSPAVANKTWNCQAFVGKLDDRTTKNGAKELVLHVKPSDTWRYPVAYKATREKILALGLAVGDKVALAGFVSTNTRTDGPYAGNTYTKFVIQDCALLSAKADRLAANASKATAGDMGVAAEAEAVAAPVASAVPASEAQQGVLAQIDPPVLDTSLAF